MANEKRLIDLDKLIKPYKALAQLDPYEYIPPKMIVEELENQPLVDAVEVVHGHMVERIVDHECPWYTVYDCSECGCSVERWHNYCPNCGADMRERRNNGGCNNSV